MLEKGWKWIRLKRIEVSRMPKNLYLRSCIIVFCIAPLKKTSSKTAGKSAITIIKVNKNIIRLHQHEVRIRTKVGIEDEASGWVVERVR